MGRNRIYWLQFSIIVYKYPHSSAWVCNPASEHICCLDCWNVCILLVIYGDEHLPAHLNSISSVTDHDRDTHTAHNNSIEYLQEAARVMRKGGWLWIAEVRSRFAGTVDATSGGGNKLPAADSVVGEDGEKPKMAKAEWVNLAFQESMKQLGFKLASRDVANKMFVIMQFRKGNKEATTDISWPELKACVYKKR